MLVKDINPGSGSSSPVQMISVGRTLFFSADDGANGRELWMSNGAEAGTVLVKDINPGTGSALNPGVATRVGGTLFFTATDGIQGFELWSLGAGTGDDGDSGDDPGS